jgi:hypothetical protein
VLRNPQKIEMTCLTLSRPCVKPVVPKLSLASGETRVRAQAVETVFQQPAMSRNGQPRRPG